MGSLLFRLIVGASLVGAWSLPGHAETDADLTPDSVHIQRCSACHYREDGHSAGPEFPNIAGQYEQYLLKALKLFKEHKRESDAMELITSLHREQELVILANHYAKKAPPEKPPVALPHPELWKRGQQLYAVDRIYGIACADCHGADAKGYVRSSPRTKQSRAIPRLAGQQPTYLRAELLKYAGHDPQGPTQFGMCSMRKAGKTLARRDIDALVEYISSK
jgi:cytochrome c553